MNDLDRLHQLLEALSGKRGALVFRAQDMGRDARAWLADRETGAEIPGTALDSQCVRAASPTPSNDMHNLTREADRVVRERLKGLCAIVGEPSVEMTVNFGVSSDVRDTAAALHRAIESATSHETERTRKLFRSAT